MNRGVVIGLGVIAVMGLGAATIVPIGRGVQTLLQTEAQAAVARSGQGWATVRLDGQAAHVAGRPPDEAARLAVQEAILTSQWRGGMLTGGVTAVSFDGDAKANGGKPDAVLGACDATLQAALGRDPIRFLSGSYELTAESAEAVDRVAVALKACPSTPRLTVEGHTDNTGTPRTNRLISAARAQAVADRLTAAGIEPDRVRAVGVGAERPVAENIAPEGRALNRRIDLVLAASGEG